MEDHLTTLFADDSGKLEVFPAFDNHLPFSMDELLAQFELRQDSIHLFGKSVLQPRLSAFYADEGVSYTYSRSEFHGLKWTNELATLKRIIEAHTSSLFNSALVNYYRHGTDSMGLHADNEPELGKNPTIASMNFGASRKMIFRKNETKDKFELILNHGDLLLMSGSLQHHWKHEIPKQKKIIQPRLNITFRNIIS